MRFSVILPVAYMLLLFFLCSLPDTNTSQNTLTKIPSMLQNLLHLPAFGGLAILWLFSLGYFALSSRASQQIAVIVSISYGGILELYQIWVPGRFASLGDFLFNGLGVLLFMTFYLKIIPYFISLSGFKKKWAP